jgi:hypothetical protein
MTKNDNWARLAKPDYYKPLMEVTGGMCRGHGGEIGRVYEFLLPYIKANFAPQRIVVSTVFAELVNHCKDPPLLHKLINTLLNCLGDPLIKLHGLRGLGNIVSANPVDANKYAPTVLDALLSSIDDAREGVAMEAMTGLSKVFGIVEDSRIAPILVNICHRIRPAFDKEHDEIRSSAFTLFGSLYRFGEGGAADPLYEQIHSNLPAMVLHLNDDNTQVVAACKEAFKLLSPLYRSSSMQEFLGSLEGSRQLDYAEFLNDLSKLLIESYPERINYYVMTCVEYFQSPWNRIKANAAGFVGFLLGNLPVEKRKAANINPGLVSKGNIQFDYHYSLLL